MKNASTPTTKRRPPARLHCTPVRSNSADVILSAAKELFASKGFQQTSIRDICSAAGITRPVLYYFYKNKIGLFRAVMDKARQHFAEYFVSAAQEHPHFRQQCVHLTRLLFHDAVKNPQMWRLMLLSVWFGATPACDELRELRENMVGVLMPESRNFSSRNCDPRVKAAAYAYAGSVSLMIARYLNTGEPDISNVQAESLVASLFDGCAGFAAGHGSSSTSTDNKGQLGKVRPAKKGRPRR